MLTDREKVIAVWIFYGKSGVNHKEATKKAIQYCCVELKIPKDIVTEVIKDFNSFIQEMENNDS